MIDPKVFKDLALFGRYLVWTKDIDPIYPLAKAVFQLRGLTRAQQHWFLALYWAFYNVSSAWAAFREFPEPLVDEARQKDYRAWESEIHPTCNLERRGLRGGKTHLMLIPLSVETEGDIERWLTESWTTSRTTNFELLWERLQLLPYIGRWCAFKAADTLMNVLDYTLEFPDMRMAYCSGPRQALEELYGLDGKTRQDPAYIAQLDRLGVELKGQLAAAGLGVRVDELETILCNFHSMMHGRYYCGHDYDELLGDLNEGIGDPAPWMAARRQVAPHTLLLGELHGWAGIRRPMLTAYKKDRTAVPTALMSIFA